MNMAASSELDALSHTYGDAYAALLEAARHVLQGVRLNAFWPQRGPDYDGALLVVGRAVNGQHPNTHFSTDDVSTEAGRRLIVSRTRTYAEARPGIGFPVRNHPDPVTYDWDYQHMRRVRLFTIADALVGLSGVCWSNLYKLSPAEAGNPSVVLRRIQMRGCVQLLRLELHEFKPRRVLFMSGWDHWCDPFATELGITMSKTLGAYVEQSGRHDGAAWVVAKHPMRSSPDLYCSEVRRAFETLGVPL